VKKTRRGFACHRQSEVSSTNFQASSTVGENPFNESDLGDSFLGYALGEHAIVSVADVKGHIIFVNEKFVEISGYSKQELIGQNHRLLKSDEHTPDFYKDLWRTIANGKTWSGELKNLTKNGDAYWVYATIIPNLNSLGTPIKYLSIRTDITGTKGAEAVKQQQLSFDLSCDEIYMFWPYSLKFLYANKNARRQSAFRLKDIKDLTPLDITHNMSEAEFRALLQPLAEGQEKSVAFHLDYHFEGGELVPAEVTVQLIKPESEAPRYYAVIRNISERKQAERAKSEFLSTISHELRTPLTSIRGSLALIKAGAVSGDTTHLGRLVDIGLKNSARLENLVNDLLDMDKVEAGMTISVMGEVDISHVIEEAITEMSFYNVEHGISFQSSGVENPMWVIGDKGRLKQVMTNLLSNASKFSNKGSMVEIQLSSNDSRVFVSVKDYGIGIPQEARANIFERFTQADSSDQRRFGGTGLGLNIAKTIIEEHGGSIEFQSEVGVGTIFRFSLKVMVS
jgi:PAS domain S-box-containing protein